MNDATMVLCDDDVTVWNLEGNVQVIAHSTGGYVEVHHDGDLIVDGYADDDWDADEVAVYVDELVAEANYLIAQD